MAELVRLQKFLSSAGVTSRRKAEELIEAGRVSVNGRVETGLGVKIDPSTDVVELDGRPIKLPQKRVYVLLNKPAGYMTTVKDERGRPGVVDLVKIKERIFPVGRLDLETEGLLILTNDGDFANLLMHPRHHVWKTYRALVSGHISYASLEKLERGLPLEDGPTAPARVKLVSRRRDRSIVELSIREGRKRQVRRMFKAVGHKVEHLKRVAYDDLTLGDLRVGDWRMLTDAEVEALRKAAGRPERRSGD